MPEARFNFDPGVPMLGTLASCEVVIDRSQSHNHLIDTLAQDVAADVLEAALSRVDAAGRDYIVEEVDCGEGVVASQCVETTAADHIVYAHRQGREGPTRFVLDRQAEPARSVMVVLIRRQQQPGIMVLLSAAGGAKAAPEPWDTSLMTPEALALSQAFWANHALVWDPASVDFERPFGEGEPPLSLDHSE